ncbi:hypothetical protein ONZ45_g9978 [Pleurotus djamor]|nr:hypothetical protein ONZ45_g9978 [Pleurotus djamor]
MVVNHQVTITQTTILVHRVLVEALVLHHLAIGSAEDDPVENDQLPERSPSPELHPPPPPDPVNEPEPEPEDWVNRPRRSGRQRKVAKGPPGSIYEEDGEQRLPHEIQRDIEDSAKWRKLVGDNEPGSSRLPTTSRRRGKTQPQANQPAPDDPGPSTQILDKEIDDLTRMSQEGGVEFMKFLLSKAVAVSEPETEPVTVPNANAELNPDNIREWTYRDIMRLPPDQRKPWIEACKEELKSLRARNVYSLVKLPKGRKAIKCRWVFDIKSDGRKKARLVAKGFSQREGIDFNEIFSPVVRYETFRMILALAAVEGWHLEGLDVKTAFLYGKLDEEIYMEQPEGFHAQDKKDFVFRLWRALYGLKQAALSWWKELSKSMEQLGFKRAKSDSGLFIYTHPNGSVVIAIIYVDDALFCGSDRQLVLKLKAAFMKRWECRDLGEAKEFLRMRILRKGPKIYLDQETYLQKVIRRFNLENCNTARTPLPTGYRPEPHKGSVDPALRSRFQQVIGSLLYIMLGTRPDIAYAVVKLSQHSANPSKEHLDKALYVLSCCSTVSEGANKKEGGRRKREVTAAWTCSHECGENNATRGSADPKVTPSWNRVKQEFNIAPPSFHGHRLTPSHIPKPARLPQHLPQVPNSTPSPSTRVSHQTPYIFHLFANISRPHANRWLLRTPSNGDVYAFDRRTLTAILDVAQWLHTGDLRPEQLEGEARRVYNMVAQTVLAETRIRGKLPYYNVHGVFNNVKWVLRKHLLGLAPPSYQRKRNLRLQNARSVVTGGRGHAFGRRRDWGNNSAIPPAKSVSITTTPATRIKNAGASSSKESWDGVGAGAKGIKDLDGMEDTLEDWAMEDFDLGSRAEDDDFVEVPSSSVAAGKKASA